MLKMNRFVIVVTILACCGCQSGQYNPAEGQEHPKRPASGLVVDIDPFYNWGRHPKVRLVGREALQVQSIIESAPEKELAPIPPGMTVSPAPGLSVIEIGDDAYHIMPDCEVLTRKLSIADRLKLFEILSKHTSHFEKPKA